MQGTKNSSYSFNYLLLPALYISFVCLSSYTNIHAVPSLTLSKRKLEELVKNRGPNTLHSKIINQHSSLVSDD